MFLKIEAALSVLALVLAFAVPNLGSRWFEAVEQRFGKLAEKPGRSAVVVLVAVLAFVFVWSLPNLSYPVGRDQSTYAVIAQGLLHGKALYRDIWDIKPPGIFCLYVPFVALVGNVWWLVGLVDILWLLAFSYVLFRFAQPFIGEMASALGVVVYACWHCRAGYVNAAQPEDFITLFVLLAYLVIPRNGRSAKLRLLAAGLLLGAAFWLKYNAIVFFGLLILVPYLDWGLLDSSPPRFRLRIPLREWLRNTATLLAGLMLSVGLVLGVFAAVGLWSTFWHDHLEILLRYGVSPVRQVHLYWLILIVLYLRSFGISLIAVAIALKVARVKNELSRVVPIILVAIFGYATGVSQVHFAPYTFETFYPFLGLIWGYLLVKLYHQVRRSWENYRAQGRVIALALVNAGIAAAFFLLLPYGGRVMARRYRDLGSWRRNNDHFFMHYRGQLGIEHLASQVRMIRLLEQRSSPGDDLYVWGAYSLLYYRTGLAPANRFIVNFPFIAPWGPPGWRKQLVKDLSKSPPSFIVVSKHDQLLGVNYTQMDSLQVLNNYPQLRMFISRRYKLVSVLSDFLLYEQKQGDDREESGTHP